MNTPTFLRMRAKDSAGSELVAAYLDESADRIEQLERQNAELLPALQEVITLAGKRLAQPPSEFREIDFIAALGWIRDRIKPFVQDMQASTTSLDSVQSSSQLVDGRDVGESGQFVQYGYIVRSNNGHETYFKGDPATSSFNSEKWRGLMEIITLYSPAPVGATGQEGGASTNNCDCGCNVPIATDPIKMLQFLAGRFEYAGVSEGVAKTYARDIRSILENHAPNISPVLNQGGEDD